MVTCHCAKNGDGGIWRKEQERPRENRYPNLQSLHWVGHQVSEWWLSCLTRPLKLPLHVLLKYQGEILKLIFSLCLIFLVVLNFFFYLVPKHPEKVFPRGTLGSVCVHGAHHPVKIVRRCTKSPEGEPLKGDCRARTRDPQRGRKEGFPEVVAFKCSY